MTDEEWQLLTAWGRIAERAQPTPKSTEDDELPTPEDYDK